MTKPRLITISTDRSFAITRKDTYEERSDLRDSIQRVGLKDPIVITTHGVIVSGERRLLCYRDLKLPKIAAYEVPDLIEAVSLMEKEGDYFRRSRSLEERVSLGMLLYDFEKRNAEIRRQQGRERGAKIRSGEVSPPGKNVRRISARDWVGKILGMAGTTFEHAHEVWEVGMQSPPGSKERTALEEMFRTGMVNGPYFVIKGLRNQVGAPEKPSLTELSNQRRALNGACTTLTGVSVGLNQLQSLHPDITADEAIALKKELWEARRILEKTIRMLKERENSVCP